MHPILAGQRTTTEHASTCDLDLVRGCRQGDRDSQRQLYEKFHLAIFRLTVRIVGPQEARDVTQQVFLQAFCKIDGFSGRARFKTWLYRLAVNEALQHLRRMQRWKQCQLDMEPEDHSPRHDEKAENRELLEQAFSKLEPELLSVFLLREVEGLSYQELVEAVGIPEGTVASRLYRARRLLQGHLLDLGWES